MKLSFIRRLLLALTLSSMLPAAGIAAANDTPIDSSKDLPKELRIGFQGSLVRRQHRLCHDG